MYGDRQYVSESLRAGASAYLLKDAAFSELEAAIRAVVAGGRHLSPAVSGVGPDDYIQRVRNEAAPTVLEKLGLHTVVDLVKFALRHGLASLE